MKTFLNSNSRLQKQIKTLALIVITIVVAWWLTRSLNWSEVQESLSRADWKLLTAASVAISFTYLLRALRWRALLSPLSETNVRDVFAATVIGFSAVFLLGRSGEVVRPALLPIRDPRVRPTASFITILIERICDLTAIVFLFAVNLIWFKAPAARDLSFVSEIGIVLFVGACVGLISLVIFERNARRFVPWFEARGKKLTFVPERLKQIATNLLTQLAAALRVLAYPRDLLITVFWTGMVWLMIMLGNLLIFRAFGVSFGFAETIFVLGWGLVGSLVPTPGGAAGAFHAATAAGLIFLGIGAEQALAISIMVHLVDFAPALVFGFYYLMRGEISLKRLRPHSALPENS